MNAFSVSSWLAFIFLGVLVGQGKCCSHGWLRFGDKCYKIFTDRTSTTTISRLKCFQEGAELISLSTPEIFNFFSIHAEHVESGHIWVGMKLFNNNSLMWDDGTPAAEQPPETHEIVVGNYFPYSPSSCYAYDTSSKTVAKERCYNRFPYACVHNLTLDPTDDQCTTFGKHSFTGEVTGRCIFKFPSSVEFRERTARCESRGGNFLDLEEILRDGLTNFYEKQLLTNDGSRYWTEISVMNGDMFWGSGDKLDPILQENFPFYAGSGSCVTVEFNFTDTLEIHLYQVECAEQAEVLCSAPSPLQTTTSPPTGTTRGLQCPRGHNWKHLLQTDYCFWETSFETSRMSWDEAQDFCTAFGGNLASFHNIEQEKVGLSFQYGSLPHPYWIGLRLDLETGSYRWSDGSPLDYQNWAPGHPDHRDKTLQCVAMDAAAKHWVSSLCGIKSWFVCRAPMTAEARSPVLPTQVPLMTCEGNTAPRSSYYQGHCYFYPELTYSWHRAQQYCNDKGYSLVSVHNIDELSFLLRLIYEGHAYGSRRVWIGLNCLDSDIVYEWKDGTPVDSTFWDEEEPKNFKTQKCASMHSVNALWHAENCNAVMSFICKRKNETLSTTVVPTTPKPVTGNCKKGWIPHRDMCYLVVGARKQDRGNWTQAMAGCDSKGGYLTSIRNIKDQAFLAYLLQDLKDDAWIGLCDVTASGSYYWMDNSDLSFTNWAPGEPSHKAMQEHCVKIVYNYWKSGVWKDDECSKKLPYICQMRKDPKLPDPGYQRGIGCIHPEGWLRLDTQCFKLFSAPRLSWVEAERNCRNHGAHLISISDFSVQTVAFFLGTETNSNIWTGLQYDKNHQKFWWLNGNPMTLSLWGANEPDNNSSMSEDFSCFRSSTTGIWRTTNCSEELPYICQISTAKPFAVKKYTGDCPNTSNSWISTDSSYCFIANPEEEVDFYTANSRCSMFGSSLVSFHYLDDVQLLKKNLPAAIESVFIGLMRIGSFSWSDRSPVDFVNWAPGQPEDEDGDCVEAFGDDLKWRTVPCQDYKNFVCASLKDQEIDAPESSELQTESTVSLSAVALTSILVCLTIAVVVIAAALFYYKPLGKSRFRIFQKQSQSMSFENALYSVDSANLEFKRADSNM